MLERDPIVGVKMLTLSVLVLLVTCSCFVQGSTSNLASQLERLANEGLALDRMQAHIDTSSDLTFTTQELNGAELIDQAADLMRAKYAGRTLILEELLQELTTAYSDVSSFNPYENCCNIRLDEFSLSLKQQVDTDKLCVAGNGLSRSPSEVLPNSIVDYMKQVYINEIGLQYIYFGSEEGIIYNYPAVDFCSNDYDPRFRPFYVETVTTQPKDVVIVIDQSGSMRLTHSGRTLMNIAIEAAQTVIDTLNANDRVGIVAFSNTANTPPGRITSSFCYATNLAMATTDNKEYLREFVSNLQHGGATNYILALRKAFAFFSDTVDPQHDSRDRSKLILFLTDGEPTDGGVNGEPILEAIADLNEPLGNEVIIITYGLGGSIGSNALEILSEMADQPRNNPSFGDIRQGFSRAVSNPSNLRSEMGTYYNFGLLLGSGEPEVTFTIPYQDAFGSGLVASICLPLRIDGTLKGVFCVDQSFGELISELTLFQIGESSYSFMTDESTRVLQHPFMENPTFVTNAPLFTYLDSLEIGNGVESMIEAIDAGEDGQLSTSSRKVVSRGTTDLEGVNFQNHNANYYWRKIPGTSYTIGFAIIEGDTQAMITIPGSPSTEFFYHKLDLMKQLDLSIETCSYFSMESVKDTSVVHFSYYAFEEPFHYLYTNETRNNLDAYTNYFIGGASNPGFKNQIKEYFTTTDFFREAMRTATIGNEVCVWRYIATENGILRIFPAVETPKDWDAKTRRWYVRTKANRDVINISPPYEDLLGPGDVITMSHVIYERVSNGNHDAASDLVIAVMGMDFTPSYFYTMILDFVPACSDGSNQCFVVDRAGYIIVHHDWIESPTFNQNIYDVHVSKMEPRISQDLMDRNRLTYEACINITGIQRQYFFRVNGEVSTNEYDMIAIDGTNAFLVVKKSTLLNSANCLSCNSMDYSRCATSPGTQCFCPCYVGETDLYEYCDGVYDLSGDTDPICTPPLPVVDFQLVRRSPAGLQSCYDYGCEQLTDMLGCNGVIGCNWCHFYQDGIEIDTPYCSVTTECPQGVLPQNSISEDRGNSSKENKNDGGSLWWIAIIVLAVVAVIACIGVCMYCRHKKASKSSERSAHYSSSATATQSGASTQVSGSDKRAYAHSRDPPQNPYAAQPAFGSASAPPQPPSQSGHPPAYSDIVNIY